MQCKCGTDVLFHTAGASRHALVQVNLISVITFSRQTSAGANDGPLTQLYSRLTPSTASGPPLTCLT